MTRIEIFDGARRRDRVPLYITSNVSSSGMFLFTQEPFAVGSDLKMSFTLPGDDKAITVRATVIWVRQSRQAADRQAGMGVHFVEIDESDRERIRRFVAKTAGPGPSVPPSS
jgi:uncharacterized protein (TIGR02266 family)